MVPAPCWTRAAAQGGVTRSSSKAPQTTDDRQHSPSPPLLPLLQSPRSSRSEIKRAYYNIMKDCHPDLSGDEESTEFCTLLNEIYEVKPAAAAAAALVQGVDNQQQRSLQLLQAVPKHTQ